MKYTVEMGSGAMIYVSSFTKISSGIQRLTGLGGFTDTQDGYRLSLLLFFKIRKIG
jgi:hypothetical protein